MGKARFVIGLFVIFGLMLTVGNAGAAGTPAAGTDKAAVTTPEKKADVVKDKAAETTPDKVEYHGNTKSKKFHAPCSKDYNCKNCTAIFASKEDAVKAGYKEVKCPESKKAKEKKAKAKDATVKETK